MPYADIKELPATVRDALPAHGQHIFLAAFNSAFEGTCKGDEECTNAVAWSAVKNKYHKDSDTGKWVENKPEKDKTETNNLKPFDNAASFVGVHDIDMQGLETRIPHPLYPDGVYYSKDNFSGTERDWESKNLVIWVPPGKPVMHVDHESFSNDPAREVERLGYRIAGKLNNTQIGNTGNNPMFKTQVVLSDPEAEKYVQKQKVGLSSAFDAVLTPRGNIEGKVVPNHVLLFLKCAEKSNGFCGVPNDPQARINNLSHNHGVKFMEDAEAKTLLNTILEKVDNIKGHVVPKPEEIESKYKTQIGNLGEEMKGKEAKIAALESQIEELEKQIESLKGDKEELDNLKKAEAQKVKDQRWQEIKNLYKPALFHKAEDEATARALFESDAGTFVIQNVNNLATPSTPKKAQGMSAVGNIGEDKIDVRAQVGTYDPNTNSMKV